MEVFRKCIVGIATGREEDEFALDFETLVAGDWRAQLGMLVLNTVNMHVRLPLCDGDKRAVTILWHTFYCGWQ
jgi:hypothetical protein